MKPIHPVAVLRKLIGMKQNHFASEIAECAEVTLKKIERRKLKLSTAIADLISYRTAVNLGYLLGNKISDPRDWHNQPYTLATYQKRQIVLAKQRANPSHTAHMVSLDLAKGSAMLAAILLRAHQDRKSDKVGPKVMDALRSIYFELDHTGVDRNGLVSSFLAGRHTATRPDLSSMLNKWEVALQRLEKSKPATLKAGQRAK